ncbi:MAG TPA: hypothetical protein VHO91_09400 [Rhodopila sp.]|nr:hypothetical protein [Rhodopila sp.]
MRSHWMSAALAWLLLGTVAAPWDCGTTADDPAMASGVMAFSGLRLVLAGACGNLVPVLAGALLRDADQEALHSVPAADVTGPVKMPEYSIYQQ